MIQPLKNIVQIRSGVFLKSEIHADTSYLQAKHFSCEGDLLELPFPEVCMSGRLERHILEKGDVLFVAKGFKHFAALYPHNAGPAVASSSFLVLKIIHRPLNQLLPEYLVAILNHPFCQQKIKARITGSNPPSISMSELGNISIPIPAVEKQHTFVQLQKLLQQETQLKQQLEELKEKLMQQQLLKAITE